MRSRRAPSGASRRAAPLASAALLAAFARLLLACDSAPEGVREWTPADHDQPPGESPAQGAPAKAGGPTGKPAFPADEADALVDVAWAKHCARCHGPAGRGDGPEGPMVKAPDLTRPGWLSNVDDATLAATIRKGKGKMPGFDLPDAVVAGLVRRIRQGGAP